MQIEVPGQAVVVIDHLKVEFGHVFGRIWVKHPRKQVIYRMRDIATTLQARVLFEV